MSIYCQYWHRLFSRVDSRVRHEKHSCQSSGFEKAREVSKITFPNEKNHGILNGIETGEAFRFKTPSSIMIVGPSGCGKTCFTESLLLDHLEELFVNPPPTIHYCYGAKDAGVQFREGVPTTFHLQKWFPKGGLLVLDDLMVEEGEDKELLDLFTKHSHHQNITVLYLCQNMFPPGKYAKCISRNAHYIVAFKNPRDQLGMKNLLLQAFTTCWQDMMDVYQKVSERSFGYTVLDLHPASDDRKRVFSHLLTHEGFPRWHRRIKKEGVRSLSKNDILNITSIVSAHLKHVVLGEARREPCVPLQQIFLAPWKKTMMKT